MKDNMKNIYGCLHLLTGHAVCEIRSLKTTSGGGLGHIPDEIGQV